MMTNLYRFLWRITLLLFVFLPIALRGDGFIILSPEPTRQVVAVPLSVRYHNVTVSIDNQVATTSVDQTFKNTNDFAVDGTYIFPLPQQAAVNNFTMQMNGKSLPTKLLDKEEARSMYESLVRTHKNPALLTYMGHGLIKAQVPSIPASGEIRLTLSYTQLLTAENGTVKYHYTLGTEQFSAEPLDAVSITTTIKAAQPVLNIYSPTHAITVDQQDSSTAVVTYKEEQVRPKQDFVLYYTQPNDAIGFNVLTYKEDAQDGFFLAMMSPNTVKQAQPVQVKNMLFVVDTSGSMWGEKIQQAQEALTFCLNRLSPEDRFNFISFSDQFTQFQTGLVNATQSNVEQAVAYVNNLHADGSTDINGALERALQQLVANDHPNMIIFLTDGQPTAGKTGIKQITANIKQRNTTTTRLFVFGVGYDVNTALLDKLSLDNKGCSDYIAPNERIEAKVAQFYVKVAHPVLTDIRLKVNGTQVSELYPVDLPDLFVGSQLLVVGRYAKGGNVTIDLAGKQSGAEKHYLFNTMFAQQNTDNDFLPRIWASRKIAYLVDQVVLQGKNDELVKEIVALSKRYGIITEYTSFLVDMDVKEFSKKDVSAEMLDMSTNVLSYASSQQVGQEAFTRAKTQQVLRSSATLSSMNDSPTLRPEVREQIRSVGPRTFYRKGDVWVDGEYTQNNPVVKVKFLSPAYFSLLAALPAVRPCLALGDNVTVKVNDCAVVVGADGNEVLSPAELTLLGAGAAIIGN